MACSEEEVCLPTPLLDMLAARFEKPSSLQLAYWSSCLASPLALETDHGPRRVHHVLTAPTGSGKTSSFLVPAISALLREAEEFSGSNKGDSATLLPSAMPGQPRIVVVAPTRELAVQVLREAIGLTSPRTITHYLKDSGEFGGEDQSLNHCGEFASEDSIDVPSQPQSSQSLREGWLSAACLYGSVPLYHQVRLLERGVHLLAATPGRLMDLLNQKRLSLDSVSTLILDEYDRLLDGPLRNQVAAVASAASSATHVLVSATTPSWLGLEDTSNWRCKATFDEDSSVLISELCCKVQVPALLRHCPWLEHSETVLHFDARSVISTSAAPMQTTPNVSHNAWALRRISSLGNVDTTDIPNGPRKIQVLPAGINVSVLLVDEKMRSPESSHSNSGIDAMAHALRESLIKRATANDEVKNEVATVLRCLVFAETRVDCERVARALAALSWGTATGSGHSDTIIGSSAGATHSKEASGLLRAPSLRFLGTLHGGKDQTDRFRSLQAFAEEPSTHARFGRAAVSILVCTDVAARGLHIHGVTDVASFVLESTSSTTLSSSSLMQPSTLSKANAAKHDDEGMRQLVHRIGRVGRAGAIGHAHCFLPVCLAPSSSTETQSGPEVQSLGWAAAATARHLAAVLEASHRPIPPALSATLAAGSVLYAAAPNSGVVNDGHVLPEVVESIRAVANSGGNGQTLKAEKRGKAKEANREVGMEMTEVQIPASDHTSPLSHSLKQAADAAAELLLIGDHYKNCLSEQQLFTASLDETSTTSTSNASPDAKDHSSPSPIINSNDEAWAIAEAQIDVAVAESLAHLTAMFRTAAIGALQQAIHRWLCENGVIARSSRNTPEANDSSNDLEKWASAVSQLLLAEVDAAAKALDASSLTGPPRVLQEEVAVVCVEGGDGVGGARGLQAALLAVLIPLRIKAVHGDESGNLVSNCTNRRVRVLEVTDKHANHGWHTGRRSEKKACRGAKSSKSTLSDAASSGASESSASSISGSAAPLRRSADPRLAHLCGGAAADCGPSCRLTLALSELEAKLIAKTCESSDSAADGDDGSGVPASRSSAVTASAVEDPTEANPPQIEAQSPLPRESNVPSATPVLNSKLPRLNIATRRGGLSSGPRARALAGDVRAFAQALDATSGPKFTTQGPEDATRPEAAAPPPPTPALERAPAPDIAVVVAGAAGCGLGAVRAVQLYEALLAAPLTGPWKDSPGHSLSSTPKPPLVAKSTEAPKLYGVDGEAPVAGPKAPIVSSRCHLVLCPGCMPDPTGDHLLGKGAYAVGRRHQIEVQDLYGQNTSKTTDACCEANCKLGQSESGSNAATSSSLPADDAVDQTTSQHTAAQCKWLSHLAQGLSKVTLATSDTGGVPAAVRCSAPSSPSSLRRAPSNRWASSCKRGDQLGDATHGALAVVDLPFLPSAAVAESQTEDESPHTTSPLSPPSVALGAVTCFPKPPLPSLFGACPLDRFPLLVASATCAQTRVIDDGSCSEAHKTVATEAPVVAALRELAALAVGALNGVEGGKAKRIMREDRTRTNSLDLYYSIAVAEDALFPPALLTVRDQMLLLLNRAARLIDGSTNGHMFPLRSRVENRFRSGVHGLSSTSNTYLNETTRNIHFSPSQPMPRAQWGRIVVSDRKVWTENGYAKEHYVSAQPDTHALCLEFQVWGPATTGASSAEIEEDREDSKWNDAAKCEDEEAYKADSTVGIEKGGRWHAAAFVAFGVYMCGSSMPWLPFQPTNKFDVAQVDRLVVLPQWRGLGAKELLLSVGCGAFHRLGLPCRIKTASPSAHAAFLASSLLVCEGHRSKGSCGTGRGGKEGWVHWFNGAPVINPQGGRAFVFAKPK